MPETFVTWEEQINEFTFDEEKVKYVKEKSKEVVVPNKVLLLHDF